MKQPSTTSLSRQPSLRDVAKLAGVSAASVSYVVNGRTSEVGAETTARIREAIAALGYRPQRRGISLKMSREFAVAFVILDSTPSFLADPFTTQVATGLCDGMVEQGYGVVLKGCRTIHDIGDLVSRSLGVDAFVVLASGPASEREQAYRSLSATRLPLVIAQEIVPSDIEDATAIVQDDFGGAHTLARHVIDRGARGLLFATPARDWPAIERREAGMSQALTDGATLRRIICNEEDFDETVAAIAGAIGEGPLPDAILGANDQIAIAALKVLLGRGLAVPESVQVTGFNDFVFRNYATPLLTTITSNAYQIGRRAARAILMRLDDGQFEDRTIELPVRLNLGGSTLP